MTSDDDFNNLKGEDEFNNEINGTIFDGIIGLYNLLLDELLDKLVCTVLQVIKKNAKQYCKQK